MQKNSGRFSIYIRPFTYLIDLLVINLLLNYILIQKTNEFYYHLFVSFSWIIIAWNTKFYDVFRFTKVTEIFSKIFKQYIIFTIVNFAFVGYLLKISDPESILKCITIALVIISGFKLFIYYFLRNFRLIYGGNFRNIVIVGEEKSTKQLSDFFKSNLNFGYKVAHFFETSNNKDQQIQSCFNYVSENKIDEIYCSLTDLTNSDIDKFIDFADNNLKTLKFLPDPNELTTRNYNVDYYGYIPIVSLRKIPLDDNANKMVKRIFDFLFSTLIIVFVLSWLTPLLFLLIRFESKGPLFFKQKRNGLNYKEFNCFKFRSMTINEVADLEQVTKNDNRITKVGKFIRKTSIDELPQFFNVFLGDMSVVGPRPHMVSHTEMYAKRVDKFMVRHFIKPGITGMAQTHGYRGEVENEKDIINRVKYDIFYIENWTLLLDVKVVFLTIYNTIKGEEKAY